MTDDGAAPHTGGGPSGPGTHRARTRRRAARIGAALVALAAVIVGIWFAVSSGGGGTAPQPSTPSASPAGNPLTGEGTAGRVLAVKIDNVGSAQRQQAGLNSADLVYVTRVEGGLSRYLAVFDSRHPPSRVGPVRSARQTDIPLLAPYGRVGFAYSGAISGLLPDLAAANLRNISPSADPRLFSNNGSSPTYIRPSEVFRAFPRLAPARDVGFRFGPAPAGGRPAATVSVRMPAASFVFTVSGTRWLVSVDGRSGRTADQVRLSTTNVIVQHVQVVPGKYTDHNAGQPSNEVFSQTTGQGAADFYRDGKVWHGQWSKPTDTSPTRYTVGGTPMNLSPGRTWIVLAG